MSRSRASAKQAGARFERVIADCLAEHERPKRSSDLLEYKRGRERGNAHRPLTHSLDLTKEGLAVNATQCLHCGTNLPPRRLKYCSDDCRNEFRNVNRRNPRAIRSAPERIRSRITKTTTGCLEYTGYRNAGGYGVVQLGGNRSSNTALAHRVMWADKHGPIPPGIVIRHRCDNPPCVNVCHMESGTPIDNMRDRDQRGRTLQGARTGRAKLTTEQVHEIRELCANGVRHREVAKRYGISTTQVSYIRNYKSRVVA